MNSKRFWGILLCFCLVLPVFSLTGCTREITGSDNSSKPMDAVTSQSSSDISESSAPNASEPPSQSWKELDTDEAVQEAVIHTVLEREQGVYYPGEFQGAACLLFDALPNQDGSLAVFALVEYIEYSFINNSFTNVGGFRNRMRIDFAQENGAYTAILYEHLDVSFQSDQRLEELLAPLQATGTDYTYTDEDFAGLRAQVDETAGEYLRQIGRENRRIVDNSELGLTYLNEVGVEDEIIDQRAEDLQTTLYPDWIGTQERLEDDMRLIYQTDYDAENHRIIYIKHQYGLSTPIETLAFDAVTGEAIEL